MNEEMTFGEVKALLAPIVDIPMEDIEDFIIIVRSPCHDCGQDQHFTVMTSTNGPASFDLHVKYGRMTAYPEPRV